MPDDSKQRLLDAVSSLAEEGARISVRAVAERAGMSRSAVYGVFPNRAALLEAARAQGIDASTARGAILDACSRLLAQHGPAGMTLADVAQEAGVGEATLYRLFGDRAGLLAAWGQERSPRRFAPELAGGGEDLDADLRRVIAGGIQFIREHPGLLGMLTGRVPRELEGFSEIPGPGSMRDTMFRYLTARIAEGRLRAADPAPVMRVLMGAVIAYGSDPRSGSPEDAAAQVVEIVLDGLRA